jgi:hypothetical protein
MTKFLPLLLFLHAFTYVKGQKSEVSFHVFLKDKLIGKVQAIEIKQGTEVIRDVRAETDASVMMLSVHVETDTKVVNGNKVLIEGTAYRHTNRGPGDIHATTKRLAAKKYEHDRNGTKSLYDQGEITFSVTDMFFEEPVGLQKIFSNMFVEMVPLKVLGSGKYQVTTPDQKTTVYTYSNGKLVIIESETPAGNVFSKRI